jgi:hypothetical protein
MLSDHVPENVEWSRQGQIEHYRAVAKRVGRSAVPTQPQVLIAPVAPPSPPPEPELVKPQPIRVFVSTHFVGGGGIIGTYPSIESIIKYVSATFGVSVLDIKAARRTNNIVLPRQIAVYIATQMTLRSLPEIGRRFGGRDHTTVLHAKKKIARLIECDPHFAEIVARLMDEIRTNFDISLAEIKAAESQRWNKGAKRDQEIIQIAVPAACE